MTTQFYQGEQVDSCSINVAGLHKGWVVPLRRRSDDGTIYGFHCNKCGGSWKIYQNNCGCGEEGTPTVRADK